MSLRISPAVRVTLGLLSMGVTLLLFLDLVLHVFPDQDKVTLQARQRLSESVAVQLATMLSQGDQRNIPAVVDELVKRNHELRSVGVRSTSGQLVAASANHFSSWSTADPKEVGRTRFIVPISIAADRKGSHWGQIEFAFAPVDSLSLKSMFDSPSLRLVMLFCAAAGALYYIYLRRTFQHLDPASAVPERVQMAFDALSEAVLVLDNAGRIVMANNTFLRITPNRGETILGKDPATFDWLKPVGADETDASLFLQPWLECMRDKAPVHGSAYEAHVGEHTRSLICNCSPVLDARDSLRGCMVSFSDVTELDEANRQLVTLMTELAHSKEQLQTQNLELQRLANSDPMTGALNRRSFFPQLTENFELARSTLQPMSFVMCDIDKFKSINDVFGHPAGDKVIQKFASIVLRSVRDRDIVCRYGGEEFCIALPQTDIREAMKFAERLREAIETEVGPSVQLEGRPLITASFGITSLEQAAPTPAAMIEQADQALYVSKHNGRNQCTSFLPEMAGLEEKHKQGEAIPDARKEALKSRLKDQITKLEHSQF